MVRIRSPYDMIRRVENKVRIVRRPRLPMQVIWDRAGSADTMDGDDLQPRVFGISTIAMRFMFGLL